MRLGIYFDLRNPEQWRRPWPEHYERCLAFCARAEELGLDSIWLSEHHMFADGYLPQPLTFAAAVAARTRRVRIGTAVLLAPLRSPVEIAEQAAIVDILSGGRLELGLGAGYRIPEFELFGKPFDRRYAETDQTVRDLRRIWAEGRVTPPPVQVPPPLWLGYQGPLGARRAGRLGAGLLSMSRDLTRPYIEGVVEGGHDPSMARIGGAVSGLLSADPEAAWPRVREHVAYQSNSYAAYGVEGTDLPAPTPVDPEALRVAVRGRIPRFFVATPEEMVPLLREFVRGRPVTDMFFWASVAAWPDDVVDEQLRMVATLSRLLAEPNHRG